MEPELKPISRKKFAVWSLSILAFFAVARLRFFGRKTQKSTGTVKMLAQDGTLVEVDAAALQSRKRKITDKELQQWVKK